MSLKKQGTQTIINKMLVPESKFIGIVSEIDLESHFYPFLKSEAEVSDPMDI